jgi:hypothetical protein
VPPVRKAVKKEEASMVAYPEICQFGGLWKECEVLNRFQVFRKPDVPLAAGWWGADLCRELSMLTTGRARTHLCTVKGQGGMVVGGKRERWSHEVTEWWLIYAPCRK